jgi:hypothetical protein
MAVRREGGPRPASPPLRHRDDGHALFRYADRVAVRCHRCDTPGWVTGPSDSRRFRCLGCSEALDGGCGCSRCGPGDWVGPVRYGGRRPCGYCGHQWVRIEVLRARAAVPRCRCGRSLRTAANAAAAATWRSRGRGGVATKPSTRTSACRCDWWRRPPPACCGRTTPSICRRCTITPGPRCAKAAGIIARCSRVCRNG